MTSKANRASTAIGALNDDVQALRTHRDELHRAFLAAAVAGKDGEALQLREERTAIDAHLEILDARRASAAQRDRAARDEQQRARVAALYQAALDAMAAEEDARRQLREAAEAFHAWVGEVGDRLTVREQAIWRYLRAIDAPTPTREAFGFTVRDDLTRCRERLELVAAKYEAGLPEASTPPRSYTDVLATVSNGVQA